MVDTPLYWVVQAMAQPEEVQLSLFPDFANVSEELAVEWGIIYMDLSCSVYSNEQFTKLEELDQYLESISGPEREDIWCNEGLTTPEWEQIRTLAKRVIQAMGWKEEVPGKSSGIYVGGPGNVVIIP